MWSPYFSYIENLVWNWRKCYLIKLFIILIQVENIKDHKKNNETMVTMNKTDHYEWQTLEKKNWKMHFSGHTFSDISLLSHFWTVDMEIKIGLWSL